MSFRVTLFRISDLMGMAGDDSRFLAKSVNVVKGGVDVVFDLVFFVFLFRIAKVVLQIKTPVPLLQFWICTRRRVTHLAIASGVSPFCSFLQSGHSVDLKFYGVM